MSELFSSTIGIVGSVASIIALLLPGQGWRSKVMHVTYGLIVVFLAAFFLSARSKLEEVSKIENQSKKLIETADLSSDGSQRGFMLASLAFLEKNKTRFPETFHRAKALCDNVGVTVSKQDDGVERLHQSWRLTDGASAMKYLLIGIAGGGI